MDKLIILSVVVLAAIAVAYLFKSYELASKLRGKKEEEISLKDNKMNAVLMLVFMIAFFAFCIWQMVAYGGNNFGKGVAASEHGVRTDWLLNLNFVIITAVFFLCNALLFGFSYKYYYREDRKAEFFSHSTKLELIWTIVPSVVLAVIIILGLREWNAIMYPDNATSTVLYGKVENPESKKLELMSIDREPVNIELYSEQFGWTARYAGKDNKLGRTDYKLAAFATNPLGIITPYSIDSAITAFNAKIVGYEDEMQVNGKTLSDWQYDELENNIIRTKRLLSRLEKIKVNMEADTSNWNVGHDDLVAKELHLVKGQQYNFQFRSKDVIHSAYFPQFRAQMNSVPGMTTRFSFTPIYTSEEMKINMNDENFEYVLLCNKICGSAHNAMQMKIIVHETVAECESWLDEQQMFVQTMGQSEEMINEILEDQANAKAEMLLTLKPATVQAK